MQPKATASIINNELEFYKQKYQQLETRNRELETSLKDYQHKYLEIKEQYDLLVYKRFARSAEQMIADDTQQLLFAAEAETPAAPEEAEQEGMSEVKSYARKKPGRKPLNPSL